MIFDTVYLWEKGVIQTLLLMVRNPTWQGFDWHHSAVNIVAGGLRK